MLYVQWKKREKIVYEILIFLFLNSEMKQEIYGFFIYIYLGYSVKYVYKIQSLMRVCFIFIENVFIKYWILKMD